MCVRCNFSVFNICDLNYYIKSVWLLLCFLFFLFNCLSLFSETCIFFFLIDISKLKYIIHYQYINCKLTTFKVISVHIISQLFQIKQDGRKYSENVNDSF